MFLKQSTAYTFRMGPFVDDTDGKIAETGLTIEDSHIPKNGRSVLESLLFKLFIDCRCIWT